MNCWPWCPSSMNANKMWCKSRFFLFFLCKCFLQGCKDEMSIWCTCSPFRGAIFMMQMSHVGMKMQSLFMMMLVRIFIPWCKCLIVEMEMQKKLGCKYPLMGMLWCECPLVGMPWCECSNPNTNYSKIPFIFKIKAFLMPETKIFSNLDLLFPEKPSFFFT